MYLFFTFTGGRGRFDRRERERELELPVGGSSTCGGDGVIYLGIVERGFSFFLFFGGR